MILFILLCIIQYYICNGYNETISLQCVLIQKSNFEWDCEHNSLKY